jgi:hypothetical protein
MCFAMVKEDEDVAVLKTSLRLRKDLIKQLKRYALDNDTNLTRVVAQACEEFLSSRRNSSSKK